MQLMPEILNNHHSLHPKSKDLILKLFLDRGNLSHQIDLLHEGVPDFLKSYEFPISPWPVLISQQIADELQHITFSLPKIIQRCILTYYKERLPQFEQDLSLNPLVYSIFSQSPEAWQMHFNRMDLIFTKTGIKLFEMNAALKFGGWQLASLAPQFQQVVNKVDNQLTLKYRNSLKIFFETLFTCIRTHCSQNPVFSILVLVPMTSDHTNLMIEFSRYFYQNTPEFARGSEFFSANDLRDVKFEHTGIMTFKGKKIGAVIDAGLTAINSPWVGDFMIKTTRIHLARKVFFPSNPFYAMLGSKLHFAIMNELADTNYLTSDESAFIKKYIPWTVQCFEKSEKLVSWRGQSVKLKHHLLDNKSEFVIKIINSGSGENIHVGKYLEPAVWTQIVERSFKHPSWIAQEYHETNQLYAPLSNGEIGVFNPVFGAFGMLGNYAGSFVRLSEATDLRNKGVINSATGARETIVFEL